MNPYIYGVQAPLPDVGRVLIPSHKGKLFDVKTDQTTNRHLKRIFRRIGIRKHITFHCARHTFATLYIYLGGDITNLQELMAHEDISTTMIYVKMAKRLEAHEQFFNLLGLGLSPVFRCPSIFFKEVMENCKM